MEYLQVPKTENQSAQSCENTESTFSPEEFLFSQKMSQQLALKDTHVDEIDISELWNAIWNGKLVIIAVSLIFAFCSIALALSKPDIYKASVLLAPASSDGAGGLGALAGQFGGLASLAGINLGEGGTNKTEIALEILKSRSFIERFIAKHQLLVPLMAAEKWDLGSNILILDDELYNKKDRKGIREVSPPKQIIPTPWEAYTEFSDILFISQDKISSLVTIEVEFYSPIIAQQWLTWLIEDINDYVRKQDQTEAQDSIDYLTKQLENIQLSNMQTVFYQLIEEQSKNMMLTEVKTEYVLKTIDPPQVPDEKDKPKRVLIILLGTMLGGILSIMFVLSRYLVKRPSA
jgi:uncharacterized protein involved in exopolysaccharide biosynthesis